MKAFSECYDINICDKCKRYHTEKGHDMKTVNGNDGKAKPQMECGTRMQCDHGLLQKWGKKVIICVTYTVVSKPDSHIASSDSSLSEGSEDEGLRQQMREGVCP